MPVIKGTTKAQTIFLRAFRTNPKGPPPDQWPSAIILRRWLKRPGFCDAMNKVLRAMRYQADFQLTAAAASGAHLLHETVHAGDVENFRKHLDALVHLMRLAHIRHRFAEPLPVVEPTGNDFIRFLRRAHPSVTVQHALAYYDSFHRDDENAGYGKSIWRRTGHPFDLSRWTDDDEPEEPRASREREDREDEPH